MVESTCVECGEVFPLPDDLEPGEIFDCRCCGVELEVKSVRPLVLMVFEEEEK